MNQTAISRLTVLEKILALVTAVLALCAGFLAYKTETISQAKDQTQAIAADTSSDLSSLQAKYDTLLAENERLKTQLALPTPTATVQAPPDATVRHKGELVVARNNVDLDSPSSDPQWESGYADIGYWGAYISVYPSVDALYLGDKTADYQTCRNTTGYSHANINNITAGDYICIKTDEGRYSALRITQLDSSRITLDVVTYDPPG